MNLLHYFIKQYRWLQFQRQIVNMEGNVPRTYAIHSIFLPNMGLNEILYANITDTSTANFQVFLKVLASYFSS